MSDTDLITIADDVITPTKRKGRPKGSKNKPKELTEDATWPEPPDIKPTVNPDWINVVLKSEVVEDGLPMIVHTYSIKGVSKLPDGGASVILHAGNNQPMILTTLTPYEKVTSQILETEAW